MGSKAAITVHRSREDVERLWTTPDVLRSTDAQVSFKEAPGDRGTEIHVDLGEESVAGTVRNLLGGAPLPKVKDELRRFKQRVETGQVARSDGTPEGERAERKLKQRPAQPLEESELEKAGVR
jgi:uncharacterized membrane protein